MCTEIQLERRRGRPPPWASARQSSAALCLLHLSKGVAPFSGLSAAHRNFHTSDSHRNVPGSSRNQAPGRHRRWFSAGADSRPHRSAAAAGDRPRAHPAQPLLVRDSPQPAGPGAGRSGPAATQARLGAGEAPALLMPRVSQ